MSRYEPGLVPPPYRVTDGQRFVVVHGQSFFKAAAKKAAKADARSLTSLIVKLVTDYLKRRFLPAMTSDG
jgi:hypothetical protein